MSVLKVRLSIICRTWVEKYSINWLVRTSFEYVTRHEKWSFPLRISSVNVIKSLMENFIFCKVSRYQTLDQKIHGFWSYKSHSPFFISGNLSNLFRKCLKRILKNGCFDGALKEKLLRRIYFNGINFCEN